MDKTPGFYCHSWRYVYEPQRFKELNALFNPLKSKG